MVKDLLNIECAVVMGANIANEVAQETFCEATIGSKNAENGNLLKEMLQTPYFRIVVTKDAEVVESCGALKVRLLNKSNEYVFDICSFCFTQNIVACGAGFCDGLNYGDNTKAAVIRLGLMEMIKFADVFYPGKS